LLVVVDIDQPDKPRHPCIKILVSPAATLGYVVASPGELLLGSQARSRFVDLSLNVPLRGASWLIGLLLAILRLRARLGRLRAPLERCELGLEFLDAGIAFSQSLLLFAKTPITPILFRRLVYRWRRRLRLGRLLRRNRLGRFDRRLVIRRGLRGTRI
jgi:hypothetical protein